MINDIWTAVLFGFLTYCILRWYTPARNYLQLCYALRYIPGNTPHWLRGDVPKTFDDLPALYKNDMTKFGNYQSRWLGPFFGGIMVYGPELTQKVLFNHIHKGGIGYYFLRPFVGDSLVTSNGPKWKHDRKMLNPVFHTSAMKSYIKVFNKATETLKQQLKNKQTLLVQDSFSKLTLDVITQCALSMETKCQEEGVSNIYKNAVDDITKIYIERFLKPYYHIEWIFSKTELYQRQVRCLDVLQSHAMKVINERRSQLARSNTEPINKKQTDFLDILLTSENMNGELLSDKEIIFNVHTFLIAGYETTATALSWVFYFLAKHQEHQDKCREEIIQVLKDHDEATWDDSRKFNYLTMCIKETLRLCSPFYNPARQTTTPMKLKGILGDESKDIKNVTLPKGTLFTFNIYNLHRNPKLWYRPDEFNPCRFETENLSKLHPYAYIPFSAGPRNCIGQHFAMLEMKVAAALLLKNTKFSIGKDLVEPGIKMGVLLRPSTDFHLKLTSV